MDSVRDSHKIDELVDKLTSKLFYHGHPINRVEAKQEIGLDTVEHPSPDVEKLMWQLFSFYEAEMEMETPFNIATEFVAAYPALASGASAATAPKTAKLAMIESVLQADVMEMEYELFGTKIAPPGAGHSVNMVNRRQGWVIDKSGAPAAPAPGPAAAAPAAGGAAPLPGAPPAVGSPVVAATTPPPAVPPPKSK
jgi:hypothetical protein